jgi:hypothetical protein
MEADVARLNNSKSFFSMIIRKVYKAALNFK